MQPLESDRQLAQERSGTDEQTRALTEDRPVWPMILFTGVAIMVAAALLRWIFAPRAA